MQFLFKTTAFAFLIYVTTYINSTYGQSATTGFDIKGSIAIEGKISTQEVTLALLRAKDSTMIKVEFPDATGAFAFEKIAPGEYFIRMAHVSLNNYKSARFTLTKDTVLEKIVLTEKTNTLNEVTVTATKPFIQQQYDKTVVNVENSIVSAGSTALEVLEKAPGISIDQNETVRMRGRQGVTIMIDGKRVPMSGAELATLLKGMPASSIEKIDLVTNPSSKNDAEGNAGIIDIKLKKGKKNGSNGSISASLTQGRYTKMNHSVSFNHRTSKVNTFLTYNYAKRKDFVDLDIYRIFNINGTVTGMDDQTNFFRMQADSHNYRAGLDYNIGPKTVIGLTGSGFNLEIGRKADNNSLKLNPQSVLQSKSNTQSTTQNGRFNPAVNLNFKHTLDSAGRELTMDLDYARFNSSDEQNYYTRYYDINDIESRPAYLLYGDLNGRLDIRSIKADYTHPVKSMNARFEAGLKSSWVKADNELAFYDRSNNGNIFLNDQSNHFIYTENINAAYVNFSKEGKKWNTQLGLRLENTQAKGHQLSNNNRFDRSYTQLFPSAYIGYKASLDHEIGLSVSRRINRPTYNQLNPFKYFINTSTYDTGNPFLKPELSYSFELTHTFKQKFIAKYSYSRTTDNIISVLAPEDNTSNIVIQTNRNLAKQDYYGLSLSASIQPASWWNAVNNATFYYTLYSGNLVNTTLRNGRPTFNLNSNNSFTLSKTVTAELSGNYESRSIYAFMNVNPIWSMSAGAQKQLWNKRASIKLNINDIFYTNKTRAINTSNAYQERFYERRDSRKVTLNFTYRFGKNPSAPAPRRSSGAEDEKRRAG